MLWQKCFQPTSCGAAHTRETPPTLMVHQRPSHRPVLTPHFPQHFLSKSRRPYLRAYWLTWGLTETPEELLRHAGTFLSEPTSRPIFLSIFLSKSIRPHLPAYWLTWELTETTKDLLKHAGNFLSISSAMADGAGRVEAFFVFCHFRQFRTQIWHFVRKQDGLTFI